MTQMTQIKDKQHQSRELRQKLFLFYSVFVLVLSVFIGVIGENPC
jgi:hypothetical protein